MITVDRETWDRWNETGEWELFRAGGRSSTTPYPPVGTDIPWRSVPPAEFVEWAKPCETCLGDGWWWCDIDSDEHIRQRCGRCLNGKRRIVVVVPCERGCGERLGLPRTDPRAMLCDCDDGLVTVGHVVVEWGPLWIGEPDSVQHFGVLPPDIDPATLVGKYALGGKVVTP